jgi:hypothetical protein
VPWRRIGDLGVEEGVMQALVMIAGFVARVLGATWLVKGASRLDLEDLLIALLREGEREAHR